MTKAKVHRVKCALCHGISRRTQRQIADRLGCSHCGYRRPRKYIRWTHCKKALAEYDRTAPDREKALDAALLPKSTTKQALEALAAWDIAEEKVQHAFWQDTNDRNSRDHAKLVSVETIRRMVNKLPTRS